MRILIIGADAAGMSAASQIRRKEPNFQVEVFDKGSYSSYALCGTPYFVGGVTKDIKELIAISPEKFETERGIKMHMRHEVVAVNPAKKNIEVLDLNNGQKRQEAYDQLVIATGAVPIVPAGLSGEGISGVFYLRSLDDAVAIRHYINEHNVQTAAVVGAGYIGLEICENLVKDGLKVTMFGREPAAIFEPEFQNMAAQALGHPLVNFQRNVDAVSFEQQQDGRIKIFTNKDTSFICDLVVVGVGVNPNSELAEKAGLTLGVKKAISVDRHQKTSNPFIFAAGDCAESFHLVTKKMVHIPLALSANRQGKVAGLNVCGIPQKIPGVLGTSVVKTFELALARTGVGLAEALAAGFTGAAKIVVEQNSKPRYYPGSSDVTVIIIFDKASGRLLGGQIAGTVDGVGQRINTLACALTAGLTVKDVAGLDSAYAPPFAPVFDPVVIACEVAAKNLA